jgi:hypothetical protein
MSFELLTVMHCRQKWCAGLRPHSSDWKKFQTVNRRAEP